MQDFLSNLIVFYEKGKIWEGRIYLFDSQNNSVEQIGKFSSRLVPSKVATTSDKVNNYDFAIELTHIIQIFGIGSYGKLFEI